MWRRRPFLWESNLLANLLLLIDTVTLGEEDDKWCWLSEEGGLFSVRSAYKVLEGVALITEGVNVLEDGVF